MPIQSSTSLLRWQIYALFSNRQNILVEICKNCKLVIYNSTQGDTNIGPNSPDFGGIKAYNYCITTS